MELSAERYINASRDKVYAALNDPEILRQCIPGCDSLEKTSDTELSATVTLKIGPVKARFKGDVELSNLAPPERYSITGQGSGGPAGFAKGGADVKLVERDGGTLLQYDVKADVGGKLAQLGGRLMESTAKSLSGKFFGKFCELVEAGEADADTPPADEQPAAAPQPSPVKPNDTGLYLVYGAVAAILVIALIGG